MTMQVGQKLLNHIQELSNTVEELDNAKIGFGFFSIYSNNGNYFKKEEADQLVDTLLSAGFELEKTNRETYRIERELTIPGVKLSVSVSHRPCDEDKVQLLKEQAEKAQKELLELQEKLNNKEVSA